MDSILIKNISLYGYHGVLSEEQERGQEFLISVELSIDCRGISVRDDLADAVDYSLVLDRIKIIFKERKYLLLESLAESMAENLLHFHGVQEARVTVEKPRPPLAAVTGGVEVCVTRKKTNHTPRKSYTVYLGLGSNLGDRINYLQQAVSHLKHLPGTKVIDSSPVYETEPVGIETSQYFYNAAIKVRTSLTPVNFLKHTKEIERKMGRSNKNEMQSRFIDIDMLIYEDVIIDTPLLSLPHPSITERWFVLVPLNYICPFLTPPGYSSTISELLDALGKPLGINQVQEKLI